MTFDHSRCATHPGAHAADTCARCGDFFCDDCRGAALGVHCARCAALVGLAWEREGRIGWRFFETMKQLALRPSAVFPGTERVGPALQLVAIYLLATTIHRVVRFVNLELALSRLPTHRIALDLLALPLAADVMGVLVALTIPTLLFWLATRGATRSSGRAALRAACLAVALGLFRAPFWLMPAPGAYASALWVFVHSAIWGALGLVLIGLEIRLWYAASRGAGLRGARAVPAVLGGVLVTLLLKGWMVSLAVRRAFSVL